MIINKFFVAHAYGKALTPEDIVDEADSLMEAERIAYELFSGNGDDVAVIIFVDDEWYFVVGRDRLSQKLVVCEGELSIATVYVSEWY